MKFTKYFFLCFIFSICSNVFGQIQVHQQDGLLEIHDGQSTDINCCPRGYEYDSANCYSGIQIPKGYDPFIYKDILYVKPDCSISTSNNCCPEGYSFDGSNCNSGEVVPKGWEPFFYNNGLYVISDECCFCPDTAPANAFYDGANCFMGVKIPNGFKPWAYNGYLYVSPDCSITTSNNCCPSGFQFDGANCYSGVQVSDDGWFVYDNQLYETPLCFDPEDLDTTDDLCEVLDRQSGKGDFNSTFNMGNPGNASVCFDPRCVPDQLIINVNGNEVLNTGSFSNSCIADCFGETMSQCSAPVNLQCQDIADFTCFDISWPLGGIVAIQVNGNTCDMRTNTFWRIGCKDVIESREAWSDDRQEGKMGRSREETKALNIAVFDSQIELTNPNSDIDIEYYIYTVRGQLQSKGMLHSQMTKTVNISQFGVYLIEAIDSEGTKKSQKFVVGSH